MFGKRNTSDTSQTGERCLCTQHPSFFSKNQLAKEIPDSVAPVVMLALAPILDKCLKSDRSCVYRALCCLLGQDLKQNNELVCLPLERFWQDISPATISSWIM